MNNHETACGALDARASMNVANWFQQGRSVIMLLAALSLLNALSRQERRHDVYAGTDARFVFFDQL